jgi:hypothetical protein
MGIPQIILIVLMSINLLLTARLHGTPRKGKYSFWGTLIFTALYFGLYYWGGFFKF